MEDKEKTLEGKKILIVDDEPDVLETLEDLLPMCHLVKARTFEEGKNELETQAFDMAILDIMGVNGYKLLEIAKKRKVIPVMLTAHALSVEDTVKSFKSGAASFVPKDEIAQIASFLVDILEAKKKGKSLWDRWLDRMDTYYNKKFGSGWKEGDKDFWDKFTYYT
jgi:DNA-binding NtrC family response regulator